MSIAGSYDYFADVFETAGKAKKTKFHSGSDRIPLDTQVTDDDLDCDLDDYLQHYQKPLQIVGADGRTVIKDLGIMDRKDAVYAQLAAAGLIKQPTSEAKYLNQSNNAIVPVGAVNNLHSSPAVSTIPQVSGAMGQQTYPAAIQQQVEISYKQVLLEDSIFNLPFLTKEPQQPSVLVVLEFSHGTQEAYYHHVVETPAILYLIFDTRFKFGRFIPKQSQLTIRYNNEEYVGYFWNNAAMRLGPLEITPFLLSVEAIKPEPMIESSYFDN